MIDVQPVFDALIGPFTDPASRTYVPWLVIGAVTALALGGRGALGLANLAHPSSRVDAQLLVARQLLGVLGVFPRLGAAWFVATALARVLDRAFGAPALPPVPDVALALAWTVLLFVVGDASRFALHRAMHAFEPLWQFHQVHHSAEVLTPLTFHRAHPVETLLYEVRGIAVSGGLGALAFWAFRGQAVEVTLLGVNALDLAITALTGNLRHSHVWLSFGPRTEGWLLSPAQHQLHHGVEGADQRVNYGTWLAVWDRVSGSLRVAPDAPPNAFGVRESDRNHDPHDLASALWGPLRAAASQATRWPWRPTGSTTTT